MLNKEGIIKRINDLLSGGNNRYGKYCKDYCLYNQTNSADLKAIHPSAVGYYDDVYSDDSVVPKLNVVKSAIDSVVSKISTAHCRPYVNTVKGSYKTISICKQLQIFFDYYFEDQNLQSKIVRALTNACIFDSGYIYLDETNGEISVPQPWNVYTRNIEQGEFKSFYIEFPNQSVDLLNEETYSLLTKDQKNEIYLTVGYFYDSKSKTKAILINRNVKKIFELQSNCMPLVPIYYTAPIVGNNCVSIADMLKGIQVEIDGLMSRIADASMLSPANTIVIPNGTNIHTGQLNNKIGNVITYNSAEGSTPFTVNTPEFISSQYITLLDNLMEKAYNMVGISQLSAQGKKAAGLNSGVALATQNDIESDRFQVLLDQYIKMFVDTAKVVCKVFKDNKDIIKPSRYNLKLTWGDVSKEFEKMRIQFSAADSLSKDPSEKLKQLQALAQAGIIPVSQIASLLELPDINRGYSIANNVYNTVMTLIDGCIYDDKYEIPEYVPFQMLKEQIVNMENSLRSASTNGSNDDDIKRLQKYFEKIEDYEEELASGMQEQTNINANTDKMNNYFSVSRYGNNGVYPQSGTENEMNMVNEGTANPYQTDAANGGELGEGQQQ